MTSWTNISIRSFKDRAHAEHFLTTLKDPDRFFIMGTWDPTVPETGHYVIIPKCAYSFILGVT